MEPSFVFVYKAYNSTKERRLAKHEIKTMSHHSQDHFITQYIPLRCTAVNEFYRMIRMGVAGHEQRPMNNEYANA